MEHKWICKRCKNEWKLSQEQCLECGTKKNDNQFLWVCPQCKTIIDERISRTCTNHKTKEGIPYTVKQKRTVKTGDILSKHRFLNKLKDMKAKAKPHRNDQTLRDCAMICLLYLIPARVSEICNTLRIGDIEITKLEGRPFMVVHNVPILKRRQVGGVRPIHPGLINLKKDWDFAEFVIDYLDYIERHYLGLKRYDDKTPEEIKEIVRKKLLFPYSRSASLRMIRNKFGREFHNHYFRHLRASHLAMDGMRIELIKELVGWADFDSASWYTHLNVIDLARKMT